jgi:hypothetical protein
MRRWAALLAAGALAVLVLGVASAHAASVVSPTGQVSSCYVKKGKAKGTLRVVPPGRRCRRNEKPLTFSAQGQSGQSGQTGSQGGSGQVDVTTLQNRVTQLQDRVTQLESILSGVTNTDLLSAITNAVKLNGISASDLTGAISSVNSLCTEVPTAVNQLNSIRSVLSGLSLTSGLLALGSLVFNTPIPSALPTYACP